jgi:hypothetical protein
VSWSARALLRRWPSPFIKIRESDVKSIIVLFKAPRHKKEES